MRSPDRGGRHGTRSGNSRLDVVRSYPMHHASPRDSPINYDAENSKVDGHSFDGRSFSGFRSYRTSEIRNTFDQHVCTPCRYEPNSFKFGSAEWFRAEEDLFRRTGGKFDIPEGLPGITSEEIPKGKSISARNPNYLDSGARTREARKISRAT